MTLSTILSTSFPAIIRLVSFFSFTVANIFLIPRIIPINKFLITSGRFAAILAVIGFFPYFGFPTQVGIIDLSLWGAKVYWFKALRPITSIFTNPNALGFVLLIGAISAILEVKRYSTTKSKLVLLVNVIGLLFTNYRTGWVAFGIVLIVYGIYLKKGHKWLTVTLVGGLSFTIVVFMMMFNIVPGPAELTELSLNGRRARWIETVSALKTEYIFGYGFGNYKGIIRNPHNSYLRMFFALGIGGGIIYSVFFFAALLQSSRRTEGYLTVGIPLFLTAFFFVQIFNSLSFIGISFHSSYMSIILGYYVVGNRVSTVRF